VQQATVADGGLAEHLVLAAVKFGDEGGMVVASSGDGVTYDLQFSGNGLDSPALDQKVDGAALEGREADQVGVCGCYIVLQTAHKSFVLGLRRIDGTFWNILEHWRNDGVDGVGDCGVHGDSFL
jgi:hypothetical protein